MDTQGWQDQPGGDDRLLHEGQLSAQLQDGLHPHLHRGHLRQAHLLRELRRICEFGLRTRILNVLFVCQFELPYKAAFESND